MKAATTKRHERVSAAFWLVIGVVVTVHACRLGLGHLHTPGPGFIFFVASCLLIGLSAIHFIGTFTGRAGPFEGKERADVWEGARFHKILLILAGVSVYIYLFDTAGFLLSTFLLMLFLFKAVEPTGWWVAIISSACTTAAALALFKIWLGVPFPEGILGF